MLFDRSSVESDLFFFAGQPTGRAVWYHEPGELFLLLFLQERGRQVGKILRRKDYAPAKFNLHGMILGLDFRLQLDLIGVVYNLHM